MSGEAEAHTEPASVESWLANLAKWQPHIKTERKKKLHKHH